MTGSIEIDNTDTLVEGYAAYDRDRERLDEDTEYRALLLAHYEMVNGLGCDLSLEKAAMRYRAEAIGWTVEDGFNEAMYRPLSDFERQRAFAYLNGYQRGLERVHGCGTV